MSDNAGIKIIAEVPYLCLYNRVLSESGSNADVASKIAAIMKGTLDWDTMILGYAEDERMRDLMILSFPRSEETEELALGLTIVSSSNTFFNVKKDVLFTGSRVYTSLSTLRAVWEMGGNTEMVETFKPILSFSKEGFIETVNALARENSVIPVAEEISYLHGSFSRDTWAILGDVITKPVTVKAYGADINGDTLLLGSMSLVGDSIEALSSTVSRMIDTDIPHVKKDMQQIIKSFIGVENENSKKLPNNKDD